MLDSLSNHQVQAHERWYAVYVRSRHERCVATHFGSHSVEYFLPTYKELHKWKNGCRIQLELPLFPGYLFTRIYLSQKLSVLRCPGVIRFVEVNHEPSPVEDCEVENLRLGIQQYPTHPHPYITAGTTVRIRRGPFAGKVGIMVRHEGVLRVIISMDLLKRAVAVELDLADVDVLEEKTATPH
jgi:transcription antitermination factor NusG